MDESFLVRPSEKYRSGFFRLVEDFRRNGELEYYRAYREALDDFPAYVKLLNDRAAGHNLPDGWAPSHTFWLADRGGDVLGNLRLRPALTSDWLKNFACNIGYDISPSFRRRGYGTLILKLGLREASKLGLPSVLVSCESWNTGSAAVIEKNGGVLHRRTADKEGKTYHIYRINASTPAPGSFIIKRKEENLMLRDRVRDYYLVKDNNCAETMLHAINDEYRLNLPEESFKLIGGFGAGMGCGKTCGALCACIAALGRMTVAERAHATPDFRERCAALVEKFTEKLGETECSELTKKYKREDTRCLDTVLLAADVFEEFLQELPGKDS